MSGPVRKLKLSGTVRGQDVQCVVVQSLLKEELLLHNFSQLLDQLRLFGPHKQYLRSLKKECCGDYELLRITINYWIQKHSKLATVGKLCRALTRMELLFSAETLENDIQEFLDNESDSSDGDGDNLGEEEEGEEVEVVSDQEEVIPEEEQDNTEDDIDIETLELQACAISNGAENNNLDLIKECNGDNISLDGQGKDDQNNPGYSVTGSDKEYQYGPSSN